MSKGSHHDSKLLREKALNLKKEFGEEIDGILKEAADKGNAVPDMQRSGEGAEFDNLKEYEKRLEGLKDELKQLKKIKKQQKKINKLEEERFDVIREIEKRKDGEKKIKGHKKH